VVNGEFDGPFELIPQKVFFSALQSFDSTREYPLYRAKASIDLTKNAKKWSRNFCKQDDQEYEPADFRLIVFLSNWSVNATVNQVQVLAPCRCYMSIREAVDEVALPPRKIF
jgi:hypothetical protein